MTCFEKRLEYEYCQKMVLKMLFLMQIKKSLFNLIFQHCKAALEHIKMYDVGCLTNVKNYYVR